MREDWWKDFFSGLIVDFWCAVVPAEKTKEEADFLEKHLRLSPASRVLDVPCGAGRHAIELASRGHRVTGVDISPEFLDAARRSDPRIEWRLAEMRDLPWKSEFDAAYCAGSSFGFLGDDGDAEFLRAVSRTLRPGGRFSADFKAAESILPNFRAEHEAHVGGFEFRARNRYDPAAGNMESVYTIKHGDRTETKEALHRIYTTREILRMLEGAGFRNVETFGSIQGEPFRLASPNLFVVTEKNSTVV